MSQDKFDQLVRLYRAINLRENLRQGDLVISDEVTPNLISAMLSESEEYGLRLIRGNAEQLQVGDVIELEIGDPRIAIGIVASDLEDLLISPKAKIREPNRYFLLGEKFCNSDDIVPDAITRYRRLIRLIALLKEAAAYFDEENCALIFIDEGKYELSIQYASEDVMRIDVASVSRLLNDFGNDIHRSQKLAILAKSVRSICTAAKSKDRFHQLLGTLPELLKSVSEGYRLFVADFSYDKVVNQLEVAKLEEIGKIHKTFADIQNQILGIPVATIIVATQMKSASSVGYEFWVNTAVLIGCWIFTVLSVFVLFNQFHTLNAIGDEISRKKQQMIEEYKAVEDLITKSFPFLETRLKTQRIAFVVVGGILLTGLMLSHVVYLVLTDPARHWLWNFLSATCFLNAK